MSLIKKYSPILLLWLGSTALAVMGASPLPPTLTRPNIKDISCLGEDRAEKMDAWLPPDGFERPVPAVQLIHGGGWEVGDKAASRELYIAGTLAANGYAAFFGQLLARVENDGSAYGGKAARDRLAAEFLRLQIGITLLAGQGGPLRDRSGAYRGTAGGHLALLVGVTVGVDELNRGGLYTDESNGVVCIVDFYGIHDLPQFGSALFRGADMEQSGRNLYTASPVTYLGQSELPPVLVIHGKKDGIVPVRVSRDKVSSLRANGHEVQYLEVDGAGHSFDLQPPQTDLRPVVLEFLNAYLSRKSD